MALYRESAGIQASLPAKLYRAGNGKFDYPADYEVIAENKISVTPISVDLTDYASLPRLADILKDINIKV